MKLYHDLTQCSFLCRVNRFIAKCMLEGEEITVHVKNTGRLRELLQLPGLTIIQRRAHGDNGAPYLPMHVDAAVGNNELNLVFRNDYDFPIRLEGHTNYDGALCWLIYRVFED